jgi:hypothetical protein
VAHSWIMHRPLVYEVLQHLCCHHLRSLDIADIDISRKEAIFGAVALALDHVAGQLLAGIGTLLAFTNAPHRFFISQQLRKAGKLEPLQPRGIYRYVRDPFSSNRTGPNVAHALYDHQTPGSVYIIFDLSPPGFTSLGNEIRSPIWKKNTKNTGKRFPESSLVCSIARREAQKGTIRKRWREKEMLGKGIRKKGKKEKFLDYYFMPLKLSSRVLSSIGFVIRLTTIVTRNESGRSTTIGSTTGQGICENKTSLPRSILLTPNGAASALWIKTYQNTVRTDPVTNPAMAPDLVALFQ